MKEHQEIFPLAAYTATASKTMSCRSLGGLFYINCTVDPAAASVVFTIEGEDPISSTSYTILESAAVAATGLVVLRVHPSLTAAANTIAKDILPEAVKVTATHTDSDSITYSVAFIGVN